MGVNLSENSIHFEGLKNDFYTQVLCSRLCHDLISPIGAIKNGLELEDVSGVMDREVKNILNFSAHQALDRLTLYRSVFGLNGIALIGSAEKFKELFDAWCHSYKINGVLSVADVDTFFQSKGGVQGYQLFLRLFLVLGDLAPLGGNLSMIRTTEGLTIKIEGRLFPLKADYYDVMMGNAKESQITPQTIFAYYFSKFLGQIDWQMDFSHDGKEELKISLRPILSLVQSDSLF